MNQEIELKNLLDEKYKKRTETRQYVARLEREAREIADAHRQKLEVHKCAVRTLNDLDREIIEIEEEYLTVKAKSTQFSTELMNPARIRQNRPLLLGLEDFQIEEAA